MGPFKKKADPEGVEKPLSPLVGAAFRALIFTTIIGKLAGNLSDTITSIIVGQTVGGDQLAAISLIRPLSVAASMVCYLFSTGVVSLCAYYMGDDRADRVNSVFTIGCVSTVAIGALFTVAYVFFGDPIVAAFGGTGTLKDCAVEYMRGYGIGFIPFFLAVILVDAITVDGSKDLAVASTVAMGVVNVAADVLVLVVLKMGMLGVGLAVSAGSFACLAVSLLHFRRPQNTLRLAKPVEVEHDFVQIVRRGSTQSLVRAGSVIQGFARNGTLLAFGGSAALAASGALTSVRSLVLATVLSCNTIVGSMVAAFSGERDRRAMSNAIKTALLAEAVLGGIWVVVLLAVPEFFCGLFGLKQGAGLETGVVAMRFYAVAIVGEVVRQLILSVQSAMNRPLVSVLGTVGTNVCVYVPLVMLLPQFMGINGAWLAVPLCEFVALAGCLVYLKFKGANPFRPSTWAVVPDSWNAEELMFSIDGANPAYDLTTDQVRGFCEQHELDHAMVMDALRCAEELAVLIAGSRQEQPARGIVQRVARSRGLSLSALTTVEYRLVYDRKSLLLRMRFAGRRFNPFDAEHTAESYELMLIERSSSSRDYRYTLDLNNLTLVIGRQKAAAAPTTEPLPTLS